MNRSADHHHYGPSRLGRRLLCPGSARMEAGSPAPASSEVATEGRLLHAWMARDDWRTADEITDLAKPDELTDEQVRQLVKCREFEAQTVAEISDGEGPEALVFLTELPVRLVHQGRALTRGTADLVILNVKARRAAVIDWKMGRIPISTVSGTMQVMSYGGAVLCGENAFEDVDTVIAAIFQPRTGVEYRAECTRRKERNAPSLAEIINAVSTVIADCERPDAPLVPGPEACEHCDAATTCPALRDLVATTATGIGGWPFDRLAPEKRAEVVDVMRMARKWAEDGLDAAKEYALAGGEIPGYAVETQQGNRRIEDPLTAYGCVRDVLTDADFLGTVKVSVSGLEDAYATACVAQGKAGTKKEAKIAFGAVITPAVRRDRDKHILKPTPKGRGAS